MTTTCDYHVAAVVLQQCNGGRNRLCTSYTDACTLQINTWDNGRLYNEQVPNLRWHTRHGNDYNMRLPCGNSSAAEVQWRP